MTKKRCSDYAVPTIWSCDESGLTVGYPSNALVTLQIRSRFNRITLQHSSNIPDVK